MQANPLASCAVAVAMLWSAAQPAQQDPEVDRALSAVRTRAMAGDVVAQFSLGSMLYYGTEDTAQAVTWFRRAAAQEFAAAEFQMGQLFEFGFGVQQSD